MSEGRAIDWEKVRGRIEKARTEIEEGVELSEQKRKGILHSRAHELAREPREALAAADVLEVIEFDLASERYGIELARVREVSLLKELTPVPCTPPFVLGIINLRGEIRTVIDLKTFFDLPASGITELNKIIIIHNEEMELGILADAIHGVRSIPLADLQPTLPTLTGVRADYSRGVTSERLVVLDAGKILSDPKILVYDEPPT